MEKISKHIEQTDQSGNDVSKEATVTPISNKMEQSDRPHPLQIISSEPQEDPRVLPSQSAVKGNHLISIGASSPQGASRPRGFRGTPPPESQPRPDQQQQDTARAGGSGSPMMIGGGGGGGSPMGGGNRFGGPVAKPKDSKKTWGQILRYAKKYLPAIIISLLFGLISNGVQVYGPEMFRNLTNEINAGLTGTINLENVTRIGKILIVFYIASSMLGYVQSYIMATITAGMGKGLRASISAKINRMPLKYFDNSTIGDTLSRITNDVDTITSTLSQSVTGLVSSAITIVGCLFMMYYTNWILACTAIATSLLGTAFSKTIIKKSQGYFAQQAQLVGAMSGHIEEVYSGHTVVKAYNASQAAKAEFDRINEDMISTGWRSQFISGVMMPVMGFLGNLGYVAVCVIGSVLALRGRIDFGIIVAFTMYVRQFSQPINQIAQAFNNLQRTAASGERVFDFLDEDELVDESHITQRLEDIKGDVEFRNVSFRYLPDIPIINDFSAKVKAGQKVAIVGPTGAGKTTMVNLLMRFYELDGGEITIDGTTISEVTRANIRDLFCMVLQDTWLFEGTIRDNVVYNKQNVTDEDVEAACRAVGMHHFISTLPDGYNTVLNDKTSLSAGQRQLLTVARAMIVNAPLLVLDEATSSVDTRTEIIVQEAMDKLMEGRTSFVIAHRLSTIRNADLILVMRNGDIIESGSHEELLAKGGYYTDLYGSQFEEAA